MINIVIVEDLPMILEGLKLLINKVKDFKIVEEYNNGKEFTDNISETIPIAGKITIYTSGCPKNQNKCSNKTGDPP